MKYDCSKTLDYVHERNKMCEYYEICEDGCPLRGVKGCRGVEYITQKHIDIVQKWSDKHSEKTRKEAFFEIFPKARTTMIGGVGVPVVCFGDFTGVRCEAIYGDAKCAICWFEPYNGEFEEAREKNE